MNLTDNEIIKALECCFSYESLDDCGDCPLTKMCDKGPFYTEKISLDLINRQKAEIERLYKEGLQINKTFMGFVNKQINEAIKEFTENIIHEIVNRSSEIQSTTAEYLNGSAHRQNEIIDIIKEMESKNNV